MLNQSTDSRVAYSTASKLRQGLRRWITSALNRPLIVSANLLGYSAAITLLQQTLDQEEATDRALTDVAVDLNQMAMAAA